MGLRLACLLLVLTACSRFAAPTLQPTSTPPLPPVFPSATPVPKASDTPPLRMPSPVVIESTPLPEPSVFPSPLFLLADKAVWVIRPDQRVIQRLTPPELKVTCFDVWPGDNRLAYGSDTGQVYLLRDTSSPDLTGALEQEPLILFDAFPDAPYLVRMDSLSWSPDGNRLAFTVDYSTPGASQTAGYPSSPSGLWLFELASRQATWVESNHYLGPNQSDPALVRRLTAGRWSPDGTALLVHTIARAGHDTLILDIQEQQNTLVDPPGELWGSAAWRRDSQAVLLSGWRAAPSSQLLQVQRDGSEPLVLVDGRLNDLVVYDALELPFGTLFLGRCAACTPDQTRLYIGQRLGERLVYNPANIRQYCASGDPRHIQWDARGQTGALDCGPGELRILQFQVDNLAELDISDYLRPLGGAEVLKLAWGGG